MGKQIGSVSVAITGDNNNLEATLKKSGKGVEDFDKKSQTRLKKNQKAWQDWSKKAKAGISSIKTPLTAVAKGVGIVAGSVAAGSAAFLAFTDSIVATNRELEILARQANMSVEDFRALSFATGTLGIDADAMGGQFEDMRRNLAEFGKVGTGPFQDYADIMGVTTDEAKLLAAELNKLSGDQALQKLVNNMEEANVPMSEMGFVLDSLGSDMDRLIPLFAEGGKVANQLESDFKGLATAIDSGDIKTFEELATNVGIASENFKTFLTEALAPLAPAFTSATQEIAKFFKTLTEESRKTDEVADKMERVNELINERRTGSGRRSKVTFNEEAKESNELLQRNLELEKLINAEFVKATGQASRSNKKNKKAFDERQAAAKEELATNNIRLQQLAKESEAAKEILGLYQEIDQVKSSTAPVEATKKPSEKPAESTLVSYTEEETTKFIEALRTRLGLTEANLTEAHTKEQAMIEAAVKNRSITREEANLRLLQSESEYYEAKAAIAMAGGEKSEAAALFSEGERYAKLIEHLNTLKMTEEDAAAQKETLLKEHESRVFEIKTTAASERSRLTEDELRKNYEAELIAIDGLGLIRSDADAKRLEAAQAFNESMRALKEESNALDFEQQLAAEEQKHAAFIASLENEKLSKEAHDALMESEEARHQKALTDIKSKEEKARIKGNKNAMKNLAAGMNAGNKTLFAIGKAAALSMAALNAKESVVSSYAAGSEIGGPWVGAAYAGAAAIAQGANIAQIAGTSFGGGGSSTSYSGGVPSISTTQAPTLDSQPTQLTPSPQINITLKGSSQSTENVRELIELIGDELGDGVTLNVN